MRSARAARVELPPLVPMELLPEPDAPRELELPMEEPLDDVSLLPTVPLPEVLPMVLELLPVVPELPIVVLEPVVEPLLPRVVPEPVLLLPTVPLEPVRAPEFCAPVVPAPEPPAWLLLDAPEPIEPLPVPVLPEPEVPADVPPAPVPAAPEPPEPCAMATPPNARAAAAARVVIVYFVAFMLDILQCGVGAMAAPLGSAPIHVSETGLTHGAGNSCSHCPPKADKGVGRAEAALACASFQLRGGNGSATRLSSRDANVARRLCCQTTTRRSQRRE